MRRPCFLDYACPCCGGELVSVGEGADLDVDVVEGIGCVAEERKDSSDRDLDDDGIVVETDEGTVSGDDSTDVRQEDCMGGMEFGDRGAAATKAFGWDGRAETKPGEWVGKGYFVIATYGEVRRGPRRRVVMDGCIVTCSGRAGRTSFRTGKEACSPTLFEDVEAARAALRDAWDWTIGRWDGTRVASRDLIERKFWCSDRYEKVAEVIPVEGYRPVRRADVLAELAAEALAEMGDAEREREQKRRTTRTGIGRAVNRRSADGGMSAGDAESDCEGRPIPCGIVQDWSKVDWDEEAWESHLRDVETRPSSGSGFLAVRGGGGLRGGRRAVGGVSSAHGTERWLLRDWETGKFVRVDGSDATLVERDDCTFFERLSDANGVAIGIERLFWRPEFAKWRLHVVPMCGTVPREGGCY